MKKFPLFCTLYFVFCTSSVFAYTQTDISNAQFLSDKGIIVKQSTTAGYRLDSTITRAELVGIALKLKGITLPSYQCRGYFTDVRNNDWICRAVEIGADHGLVTRANARFRAQDNITRAEALAIVTRDIEDLPNSYEDPANYIDANSWQIKIIQKAMAAGIINPEVRIGKDMGGMFAGFKEKNVYFYPNRPATRAEVFAFVRGIIVFQKPGSGIKKYGVTDYDSNYKDFSGMIFDYAFGPKIPAYGDETKMTRACTVDFVEGPEIGGGFGMLDFIAQNINTPIVIELSEKNKVPTLRVEQEHVSPPGTTMIFMKNSDTLQVASWGNDCVGLMNLSDALKPSAFVILSIYYHNLTSWNLQSAYSMRSPAGVSLETFESWYKNTEKADIRYFDGSFKDLGDNTYEFLVDMTENGIKSTYKVKSKVDLENFKINNISSVKQ